MLKIIPISATTLFMKQILWFRRDLRVRDNPSLSVKGEVFPLFIFDKNILQPLSKQDKRVSFVWFYLKKLKSDLLKIGLNLHILYGDPLEIFCKLKEAGFEKVYASGDYDSYAIKRDKEVSDVISFERLKDTYIFDPDQIKKDDGSPYLVFTPFYQKVKFIYSPSYHLEYLCNSNEKTQVQYDIKSIESLSDIYFEDSNISPLSPYDKLKIFKDKINSYSKDRDFLNIDSTSHLGVDLRFGTISIREVLRTLIQWKSEGLEVEPFFRQLIFREFYAHLLYHFNNLEKVNYRYKIHYINDEEKFIKFSNGETGVPIVDASIRELLATGNMHNRARMVVASFLTKDLHIDWRWGEDFFANYLMDFDKSSNVLSWQWCAGTGIDPQPYFRIFNPYSNSKKFDPDGSYIKHWLPQLKDIPSEYLHSEKYLLNTKLFDYPKPIVIHSQAREKFFDIIEK